MDSPNTADDSTPLGPAYRRLFAAASVSNLGDGIGLVAYPWLASAVTRNPLLISVVVVAQRLPWLLFSLPAGVVTDRYDRAKIMIGSNLARAVCTASVAFIVLGRQDDLPSPDQLAAGTNLAEGTDVGLYVLVLVATVLLGIGEVLYDNANQSFMPHVVEDHQLEKANGRLWSAETVANSFVGPPFGAWLLVGLFALPFFVDAISFALGALFIALISTRGKAAGSAFPHSGTEIDAGIDPQTGQPVERPSWTADIKEGFGWLWRHEFLRWLAIILGLLNMFGVLSTASLVLFAQEELETSPTEFALMTIGTAVGGIVGGWTASAISRRIGPGPSLWLTLIGGGLASIVIGLSSSWLLVAVMFAFYMMVAVLWNVITVSLRQTIIPDHLLGRVNSVYRFFAWGMMPLGALLSGGLIVVVESLDVGEDPRGLALRAPWVVAGIGQILLMVLAGPKLTTAKIEAARSTGRAGPDE